MPVRRPRATYHHGDLAAAALAAALLVVEREGAGSLALRSLAGELGVNHRALYRHFPAKDSLLTAVAAEGFRHLSRALAGATDARDFLDRFTAFVISRARLYELMTSPIGRHAIALRARESPAAHVIAESLAMIGRGLPGDAGRDMVFKVWGVVHGLAMLYRTGMLRARAQSAAISYIADAAYDVLRSADPASHARAT